MNGRQIFFCPGCKSEHAVNTGEGRPSWTWNGSVDAPTFTPSILVTCRWSHVDPAEKDEICHSFVTAGHIQFLSDCTHEMAGQTVEIPEWPYAPGKYGGIVE
jgi:hypothetical protein